LSDHSNLTIINHPVITDRLDKMRSKETPMVDFKRNLREIAHLMTFAITSELQTTPYPVETPMEKMSGQRLEKGDPVIVSILRAGLGLSEAIAEILSSAPVGYIGVCRDEETHLPKEYLVKLPSMEGRDILLVDPMLATGHSALHAIDVLMEKGVQPEVMKLGVLVASPEGVKTIHDKYPSIKIYTAALDRELNTDAYIMPGLGDAGDRLFGT